jgi:two-component system sensor histidine kinase EvgS
MKKLVVTWVCLYLIITTVPASSHEIIVGGDFDYPPYSFIDENGSPAGHDIEIMREIAKVHDLTISFELDHWDTILNKLLDGEIDVVAGIVYSEKRDELFDFSIPIQSVHYTIFANPKAGIRNADDLPGKRAVALQGDIANESFLKPLGLYENVFFAKSLPEAMGYIEKGKYDYVLAPYPLGNRILQENDYRNIVVSGAPILPSVYCLAVKNGNSGLLKQLNSGILELKKSGKLTNIQEKWIKYTSEEDRYKKILNTGIIIFLALLIVLVIVGLWLFLLRRQVRLQTKRIRQEEENYQNIFFSANDAMLILNRNGIIEDINPIATELYGYTKQEMLGLDAREIISDAYHLLIKRFINGDFHDQYLYGESVDRKRDGTKFNTDIKITNVTYKNSEHILAIIRDITDFMQSQKELEKAIQKAEMVNKVKSRFFADINHEIKNPLSAVIGYIYLLKESKLGERERKYVDIIDNSSKTLLKIIEDILDLSKLESGKFKLEPRTFNIKHTVQSTHDLLMIKAREKALEFALNFDEQVPEKVFGDPLRLQQVLMNLCTNAIKNTAKGKVAVDVKGKRLPGNKVEVLFSIEDTGVGIKDEDYPKLFGSFEQIKNVYNTHLKGTGLGLKIARHLAERMGGGIWFESEYGIGSTFYFNCIFDRTQ